MPEVPGNTSRYLVVAGWDDVPHLTEEAKAEMLQSIPPYLRQARTRGIPHMGAGLIYPIDEAEITVKDITIPDHWPRAYGMDTGWNWTACVWGALDRESDTVYIYSAYKKGQAEPPVHSQAIKSRGDWIPGVGDAADINMTDGEQFLSIYRKLGLKLRLPDKRSVEANIHNVWLRLSTGTLKVFQSCVPWFEEYRLYRRTEQGKIVRENDHLQAATQYLIKSGISRMIVKPVPTPHRPRPAITPWS